MILTKENIVEWKKSLDQKMYSQHQIQDFSDCISDKQWVEDYEGLEEQRAIDTVITNL